MHMEWINNINSLYETLKSLVVTDLSGEKIRNDAAYEKWLALTLEVKESRKAVYLIGNGASASMASHMAADLAKNAHVHTEVFFDLSLITAVANDLCYEEVFAEPLRRRMNDGDMLVAISSSGNSPNIIRAVEEAERLGGYVVSLSAMKKGNQLRSKGNLNFYIPAETYGMAESCHATILHYWMDLVSENVSV